MCLYLCYWIFFGQCIVHSLYRGGFPYYACPCSIQKEQKFGTFAILYLLNGNKFPLYYLFGYLDIIHLFGSVWKSLLGLWK